MRVLVLGSGAGGGVPQWNCRCRVCQQAWTGDGRVRPRTQTSLAITADDERWVLLDAAPELRNQILDNPDLHPRSDGRNSPIAAVIATSGDVDHIAGLLTLREGHSFVLAGTQAVMDHINASPIFGVLNPANVEHRVLKLDEVATVAGLSVTPFPVPGKVPLYREAGEVHVGAETEAVVGLEITDGQRRFCYVPGIASLTPDLVSRLGDADVLAFDGTAYTDDELPRLGLSPKTASRMGHLAMTGDGGSLHAFAGTRARRLYIHLNNTNPVLLEGSAERGVVEAAGWAVAHDGLEILL